MKLATAALVACSLVALPLLDAPRANAQPGPIFDHLKCYKIKDSNPKVLYKLDLTPEQTQFLAETGCFLKNRAKWFCIDVQKTNVTVVKSSVEPPPTLLPIQGQTAQDYLCYLLKCPETVEMSLLVEDQFGQRDILVKKKPDHLCVPANKVGVPQPTPTRTPDQPTPTPTRTPVPCDLVNEQCTGDCPDPVNQKCLFTGGPVPCNCVQNDQMCMDRGGICGGLCPGAPGMPKSQCTLGPAGCDCFP